MKRFFCRLAAKMVAVMIVLVMTFGIVDVWAPPAIEAQTATVFIQSAPAPTPRPELQPVQLPAPDPMPVMVGDWRIGIVTQDSSRDLESYLAALRMENHFGQDRISRTTSYWSAWSEMNRITRTIENVHSLAAAGAQTIVFVQGVPGVTEAIRTTHEIFGDDILFIFVGSPLEPIEEISSVADIVADHDFSSEGRAIIQQAASMGADTFAHISFPRHLLMANIAERREQMLEYADRYGIRWVELNAPDPMHLGLHHSQMFLVENMPKWIQEHGQNTAFFSTNCGMQLPLIQQIIEHGGLFPRQCCPSPFHMLPEALNISMEGREEDTRFLMQQLSFELKNRGVQDRISTSAVSTNMLLVEVSVRYSIEFLEGRTNGRNDRAVFERVLQEVAGSFGTQVEFSNFLPWNGTYINYFYRVLPGFANFLNVIDGND